MKEAMHVLHNVLQTQILFIIINLIITLFSLAAYESPVMSLRLVTETHVFILFY